MSKVRSGLKQIHIELSEHDYNLLQKVTNGAYGANALLIRGLLRRFFKENGLLAKDSK